MNKITEEAEYLGEKIKEYCSDYCPLSEGAESATCIDLYCPLWELRFGYTPDRLLEDFNPLYAMMIDKKTFKKYGALSKRERGKTGRSELATARP